MRQRSTRPLVDTITGEIIYALVPVDPTARRGGQFFMAMMAAFAELAANPLPQRATRVLHYLLSRLDYENYVQVEQRQLAESLGIRQPHISASLRQLVDRGILQRGPRAGRTTAFRLSPHFGWRGTAKGHRVALAEARQRWGQAE